MPSTNNLTRSGQHANPTLPSFKRRPQWRSRRGTPIEGSWTGLLSRPRAWPQLISLKEPGLEQHQGNNTSRTLRGTASCQRHLSCWRCQAGVGQEVGRAGKRWSPATGEEPGTRLYGKLVCYNRRGRKRFLSMRPCHADRSSAVSKGSKRLPGDTHGCLATSLPLCV